MTTKSVKLIVFIALLVHGIGHFQGVAAGFGLKINQSAPALSWLLRGMGEQVNRYICLAVFFLAGVTGILTALAFKGILLSSDSWQVLALITAFLSTICLFLFPNGFAMFFNKIGAVAVNLLIYYSILFNQQWPSLLFQD